MKAKRTGRARPRMYFLFRLFPLFYLFQGDEGYKTGTPHYDGASSSGVGKVN